MPNECDSKCSIISIRVLQLLMKLVYSTKYTYSVSQLRLNKLQEFPHTCKVIDQTYVISGTLNMEYSFVIEWYFTHIRTTCP